MFIIVFIVVSFVVGKIIFESTYPALKSGYKPALTLPESSDAPKELSNFSKDSYDALADNVRSGNTFRNNVENIVLNVNPD